MMKILDTVGTLQLLDTGRRCSVRNVRILAIHCPKCAGPDQILHDAILEPYWSMAKSLAGYHQGCDPNSVWMKDQVGAKLLHDKQKSLFDLADACPACNECDCTGATS